MKQIEFTYQQFLELYPDDKTCLDQFFKLRYGHQKKCSKCHKPFKYYQVSHRKYYECAWCAHKISPLAKTIFHKSSTKMQIWFLSIFLFSHSKNGVSAKELQRLTGVTYKCAWRICHQIRKLLNNNVDLLGGIVEMDETYIGGKEENKRQSRTKFED